jgi:hypothetical protein
MNVFNFSSALSLSSRALVAARWTKNGFIRVTAIDKG